MRRTEDLGANVTKELFTDVTIQTFDGNSWKITFTYPYFKVKYVSIGG